MSTITVDRMNALIDEVGKSAALGITVANKVASSSGVGQAVSQLEKMEGGVSNASTGDRAAENDADVRRAVPGKNVMDAKVVDQPDYNQIQAGPKKSPVGEDPSIERDLAGRPIDSPTSSPANADAGEKFSAMTFAQLRKISSELSMRFLDDVINGEIGEAVPAKQSGDSEQAKIAAQAGYNLASEVAATPSQEEIDSRLKQAAHHAVASAIQEGYRLADLVGPLVLQASHEYQKLAAMGGLPPEMTGGLPPDISQAAAPAAPADNGRNPATASEVAPAGHAEPSDEEVNEVVNMLIEQGIPIEQLIARLQELEAAEASAGNPPEQKQAHLADLNLVLKSAKAAEKHLDSGKFRRVKAAKGSQQEAIRTAAFNFICETVRI